MKVHFFNVWCIINGASTKSIVGESVSKRLEQIYFNTGRKKKIKTEQNWADITSDSDSDEDELEILLTFALAFVKDGK